jgi:hypothetical protein
MQRGPQDTWPILSDEMGSASKTIRLTILIDNASGHRVGNIRSVTRLITATNPFVE